jgi:hypothetical protein
VMSVVVVDDDPAGFAELLEPAAHARERLEAADDVARRNGEGEATR